MRKTTIFLLLVIEIFLLFIFQNIYSLFKTMEDTQTFQVRGPQEIMGNIKRFRQLFSGLTIIFGLSVIGTGFYLLVQYKKSKQRPEEKTIPPLHDYLAQLKGFLGFAGSHGVIAELTLFCFFYGEEFWRASPMHPANTVQAVGPQPALLEQVCAALHVDYSHRRSAPRDEVVLGEWIKVVPEGVSLGKKLFAGNVLRSLCYAGLAPAAIYNHIAEFTGEWL